MKRNYVYALAALLLSGVAFTACSSEDEVVNVAAEKVQTTYSVNIPAARGGDADTRTPSQKAALLFIIKYLKQSYPNAIVLGHRDFPGVHKDCPCFDAKTDYSYIR